MVSTRQMAIIANATSNNNAVVNLTPIPSSTATLCGTPNIRPLVITKQNNIGNNNNINEFDCNASGSGNASNTRNCDNNCALSYSQSMRRLPDNFIENTDENPDNNNENSLVVFSTSLNRPNSRSLEKNMKLLDLPEEVLNKIFSYLDYKSIGEMRLVSRKMNTACMRVLNSTFYRLINTTHNRFQAIKAKMPRRESARRKHPLVCESDIIETCCMRLSLLQMTLGKHVERGHCCFFPGLILDEVYNILRYVKAGRNLERRFRVTDELFDLSTMAMEYFREFIEPTLPSLYAYLDNDFISTDITPALVMSPETEDDELSSPPQSNMVLRKDVRKIKEEMKMYNNQLAVLRNELRLCKRRGTMLTKQIGDQQNLIKEQRKQNLELENRLNENDKKNEEMSRKFSILLQLIIHYYDKKYLDNTVLTELQYGRSKSSANSNVVTEDYQAAISQLHKIEYTINDNNSKDIKNMSDKTLNHAGFAFPDESTTAKLLSMNSVTKRLKRSNSSHNAYGLKKIWDENLPSTSSSAVIGQSKSVIASMPSLKSNDKLLFMNRVFERLKRSNSSHNAYGLKNIWDENLPSTSSSAVIGQSKSVIASMPSLKSNDNNKTSSTNTCSDNNSNSLNNTGTALENTNITSPDTKKAFRIQKASITPSGRKRKNYMN